MEIKDNETIGLKAIIVRYLLHWKLFVAAFLVSVIPAVLYILLYPRTYEVIATIQIQEDKDLGGGGFGLGEAAGLMKSFGLGGATGAGINIDDELSTLTSNQLLSQMVSELGLDVEYSKPFSFGYLLYNQSPLIITTDSATRANIDDEIEFKVKSKSDKIEVVVEGGGVKKKKFTFATLPSEIELPAGNFMLRRSGSYETAEPLHMNITFIPACWVAEQLSA